MKIRKIIPDNEEDLPDALLFEALDLSLDGLKAVKDAWAKGDGKSAKKALITYFEKRNHVTYFYDYRSLPLKKMEPDQLPYAFQSSLGLEGGLKEYCLQSARLLMKHRYLLPGGKEEVNLGPSWETMIHYRFPEDQGKCHRHFLNMFVRGQFFEGLCVLYQEEGDKEVLTFFHTLLQLFFKTYPLKVEDGSPDASRFQYSEDRDVMSAGWLAVVLMGLFYTRLPYELDVDDSFEILKHVWFLGMQFKRFETDEYRPYNHHMWERGLVPFLLSILLPEIADFLSFRKRAASIVCRHVKEDFNSDGGYNEHSIAYWAGAALGEMLFRGIYLAKQNDAHLLDEEALQKINATFSLLAMLTPPGLRYPSLGDNGGPLVNPILGLGKIMLHHPACTKLLSLRTENPEQEETEPPLDYCSQKAGFLCSKSSYGPKANYLLMSVKTGCGCSGHNHMDLLSLFLTFRSQEFIGEPHAGKLYHSVRMNSPLRGYMYNMTSHNTVLAHQNPILPDSAYANKWGVYRPDTPVSDYRSFPEGIYARAYHDAYTYCRHIRSLLFNRTKGLILLDEMERGSRLAAPHIQRWHLEPGVALTILNGCCALMEKKGVRLLFVFNGATSLRAWKNEALCPNLLITPERLPYILDVSFLEAEDQRVDISTVSLSLLILDITEAAIKPSLPLTGEMATALESLKAQLKALAPSLGEEGAMSRFPTI